MFMATGDKRMNDRPRQTHGWRSPAEALAKESAKAVAVGPLVKAR
jgi:IS30 family transposase